MGILRERLLAQGAAPPSLVRSRRLQDFGDRLGKDIGLSDLLAARPDLRPELKSGRVSKPVATATPAAATSTAADASGLPPCGKHNATSHGQYMFTRIIRQDCF